MLCMSVQDYVQIRRNYADAMDGDSACEFVADMLDADQTKCDVKNLDGKITNKGENASMQLYTKQNVQNAKALFTEIHKNFNLDKAMNEFKANPNNTVE